MEFMNQIFINIFSVIIIIAAMASLGRPAWKAGPETTPDMNLYRYFAISISTIMLVDAVLWYIDSQPINSGRPVHIVLYIIYYGLHLVPSSIYILYTDYHLHTSIHRLKVALRSIIPANLILFILAAISPMTGMLFTIDKNNAYARGYGVIAFAMFIAAATMLGLILVIVGRKKAATRTVLTLLLFPILMITGGIIQAFNYGVVMTWPSGVIFVVAAALNIQKEQIHTDHLTGLMNRRRLEQELFQSLHNSAKALGGILIDLNDFKQINDTWGHHVGDRALQEAADILRHAAGPKDIIARVGGDEFILLSPGGDASHLEQIREQISYLATLHKLDETHPYSLSFSMGSDLYDEDRDHQGETFLMHLDNLMYQEKAAYKSRKLSE